MKFLSIVALVMVSLVAATAAWAQADPGSAVGAPELQLLQGMVTGNIGYAIGLIVAIIGILIIVRGNFNGGLAMIVLGVLLTLAPSVYTAVMGFTCPLADAFGASCGGTTANNSANP